jgi:hypothetical protein
LFPIVPGLWELYAWSRRRAGSKPWFTTLDRISIRTFVIGLSFLAILLCVYPQAAFVSLSTRGDWMLDGIKDPRAQIARRYLFASAGGLEWLYHATRNNPFKAHIDAEQRRKSEEAAKEVAQALAKQREQEALHQQQEALKEQQEAAENQSQEPENESNPTDTNQEQTGVQQNEVDHQDENAQQPEETNTDRKEEATDNSVIVKWPWKNAKLHPAVANMPASVETSIESVAQYIAKQEKDPVQRIKALHDYVADRIAYDTVAFYSGEFPPQDAETVFKTRKAVCAGSANLLSALGSAINEDIVVVVGDARGGATSDNVDGNGHAWNAAKIKGHWYLIDATWDAGYSSKEKGFEKSYRTDYFLIPPEVMIQDHFPEDPTWQLLAKPLSQGDFLRQLMLEPRFQAVGLTLVTPQRAENESGANAVAVVKNPTSHWLMGTLELNGQQIPHTVMTTNKKLAQIAYKLPNTGKYTLKMYAAENGEYSQYDYIGSVDFINR